MQPRTDFLLRSPSRLPNPRKQGVPAINNNMGYNNLHTSKIVDWEIQTTHTPVEQQADTSRTQNTLLHGEALLVTTSHNLEYIALEFL